MQVSVDQEKQIRSHTAGYSGQGRWLRTEASWSRMYSLCFFRVVFLFVCAFSRFKSRAWTAHTNCALHRWACSPASACLLDSGRWPKDEEKAKVWYWPYPPSLLSYYSLPHGHGQFRWCNDTVVDCRRWLPFQTCSTPVLNSRPSSYRVARSNAVNSVSRVRSGGTMPSTHNRAAA
jgi:hypothetical protein